MVSPFACGFFSDFIFPSEVLLILGFRLWLPILLWDEYSESNFFLTTNLIELSLQLGPFFLYIQHSAVILSYIRNENMKACKRRILREETVHKSHWYCKWNSKYECTEIWNINVTYKRRLPLQTAWFLYCHRCQYSQFWPAWTPHLRSGMAPWVLTWLCTPVWVNSVLSRVTGAYCCRLPNYLISK